MILDLRIESENTTLEVDFILEFLKKLMPHNFTVTPLPQQEVMSEILDSLIMILPMVKGYAYQNQVGANMNIIKKAEEIIALANKIPKQEASNAPIFDTLAHSLTPFLTEKEIHKVMNFINEIKKPKQEAEVTEFNQGYREGYKDAMNNSKQEAACKCKPDRNGQLPATPDGICGKCSKPIHPLPEAVLPEKLGNNAYHPDWEMAFAINAIITYLEAKGR